MRLLAILLAGLVLMGTAVILLPWYSSLGAFVLLILVGWLVVPALLAKAFKAPFKMKGAALRGARIDVHGVRPAEAPARATDDQEDEDEAPEAAIQDRRYYRLDIMVTPPPPHGESAFTHWEPGELVLVPPTQDPEAALEDESCEVFDVRIYDGTAFVEDEDCKYEGPRRIELLVGVPPNERELALQYYFERLGRITFPEASTRVP